MKPYVYIHTFDRPNVVWVEIVQDRTFKVIGRNAARLYAACALLEPVSCHYPTQNIYPLTRAEYEAIIGGNDG